MCTPDIAEILLKLALITMCTPDIAEILLKLALNTNQSNHLCDFSPGNNLNQITLDHFLVIRTDYPLPYSLGSPHLVHTLMIDGI
jgi:hypothetical protein